MYSKKMGILLALILICVYTWGDAARAQSRDTATTAGAEERIADDIVTAGGTVHVQSEVAGDVAAAGGEVTIDGPVHGYVMSAGRSVRLDGKVGNDVWAAGETVIVDSPVGNNAMVAGRVVNLGRNAVIGHDARLAGNTVTAEGRIDRDRAHRRDGRTGAGATIAQGAASDRVRATTITRMAECFVSFVATVSTAKFG